MGHRRRRRRPAGRTIDCAHAADLAAEVERLVGLGATRLADHTEEGASWVTLADPEGNEFDVVAG